jgi:3-isopropylmalate/(R)-2-methylmalate dehydratase large subunit
LGKTISEKILAEASRNEDVSAGEIIKANIDVAMMPALTALLAFDAMKKIGQRKVWDKNKVILFIDHIAPPTNITNATLHKECRRIAKEQDLIHFYDINEGVCHQVLPEKGHVTPGSLIVGADSHTCTHGAFGTFATGIGSTDMGAVLATGKLWFRVPETVLVKVEGSLQDRVTPKDIILNVAKKIGIDGATYQAIEFTGETISEMSMAGRMTLCNMAIEMGGKTGIIHADEITRNYLEKRINGNIKVIESDPDATYKNVLELNVTDLEPQVACPHEVDNVKTIEKVVGTKINQAFIGSCTNGRLEDLKIASEIIEGKQIHSNVRLIVTPASLEIYREANRRGYLEIFMDAGGIVCNPSCGACFGGNNGILAPGEVGITTSNRNFKGRQGSTEAFVYLSSPATAAASAIKGSITDPRRIK